MAAIPSHIKHTHHLTLRAFDWYRNAGKLADAIKVVFTSIDYNRTPFYYRRADAISAA
ncbi:hypothetical protein TMM008_05140 [Pseudomonas sp. 008]|nr:hypothetical protein TMM008_05140 [Pseudomonas sp. 008]